ncbi:MAG: 2-oxoglutarate dehydrogenase complex dihydrolipoyllysine-residue succinyltransferase [Pseudomonadota bacterium]
MTIEVKVPVLPESVADATIATWHKQPGDPVRRDENLIDLETDKVVLEVPSPTDGVLADVKVAEGDVVTEGQLLGMIEEGAAPAEPAEPAETPAEDAPAEPADEAVAAPYPGGEAKLVDGMSPSARRLAADNAVDATAIEGSGRGGRITREDVAGHMAGGGEAAPAAPAAAAPLPAGDRPVERVKMTRLRQRIAERMIDAQSTAAMLTSFNEVDLGNVMALRAKYKADFQDRHGVKLGFMSFFVKACCEALKKHPIVNASVDDGDIIYHGYCDVGIAVSTERGLMVPVVRDADAMTLAEIEKAIADYAGQARSGSIKLEDLQGGTFTITNGGVFGSLISTPILNMPQSAILGMHAIKQRPMVVDGEIVARPMMYIALTYDHRIVDGQDAVLFLVAVKEALEDPSRLLLNL